MPHLKFITKYRNRFSPISNFWYLAKHDIPESPGVYMLVAKPSVRFRYPEGWSSVYYIGHASSLRRRLLQHLKWHTKVREDNRGIYSLVESRHEYGAKFGERYCYIETWRKHSSKDLEDMVLAEFAKFYHSFPSRTAREHGS